MLILRFGHNFPFHASLQYIAQFVMQYSSFGNIIFRKVPLRHGSALHFGQKLT
eukprot:UN05811